MTNDLPAGPELLPCPFCAGTKAYANDYGDRMPECQVFCPDCGCHGPLEKGTEACKSAWNTRAPIPVTDAMVEAASAAYIGASINAQQE